MNSEVPAEEQQRLMDMYGAFNGRDVDMVLAALAHDVTWPNGWEGGVVEGHDAVRDYWARQWAEIDPVVTPTAFALEDDGRVAVTVQQVVRDRTGTLLADLTLEHVYRFRNGLVTDMEIRD